MAPDATAFEAIMSELVCTVTGPPAVGVLLIVKSDNVTVVVVLAARNNPLGVVMAIEVAPGYSTPTI